MEDNLHNPVSLSELTRSAGYSQWHAARVFKEIAGITPFEYLRALRLSKAAEELRAKPAKQPRDRCAVLCLLF